MRALPHPAPAPPIVLAWPIMTPAVMEATTEVAAAAFAAASSAMAASDADDLQIQVDAAGEMAGGPDDFRHCVWADQVMLPSLTAAASAFDPVRAAVPAAALETCEEKYGERKIFSHCFLFVRSLRA